MLSRSDGAKLKHEGPWPLKILNFFVSISNFMLKACVLRYDFDLLKFQYIIWLSNHK